MNSQKRKNEPTDAGNIPSSEVSAGSGNGSVTSRALRILFVDDEKNITAIVERGLRRFGFTVDTFNDPVQALSQFKAGSYDIALLDIRMPGMTGFELCKQLQQIDKDLIVCFLTAFQVYEKEFKSMFPNYDVKCFIQKPVKMSDLAKRLEVIANSHFNK